MSKMNKMLMTISSMTLILSACNSKPYVDNFTAEEKLSMLTEKIAKLSGAASSVKSGTFQYKASADYQINGTFEFGTVDGKEAFTERTQSNGFETSYYYYATDDGFGGYGIEDGMPFAIPSITSDNLKGSRLCDYLLNPGYDSFYGLEFELGAIKSIMESDNNHDLVIGKDKDDNFTYSFTTTYETTTGPRYYAFEGSVSFDKKTNIVTSYNEKYASLTTDDITIGEDGVFTIDEGTVIEYKEFSYTAISGTRGNITLPYQESDFLYSSFGLGFGDTTMTNGGTYDVPVVDGIAEIKLLNAAPNSASNDFDEFKISVIKVGETEDRGYHYYSSYDETFYLMAGVGNSYTVTISTTNYSFTFTMNAVRPAASGFKFETFDPESFFIDYTDLGTEYTMGLMEEVIFKVSTTPAGSAGEYTITCKDSSGTAVALSTEQYEDMWGEDSFEYYVFTATKKDTYTITATLNSDDAVTSNLTINVLGLDDVLNGKYYLMNAFGDVILHELEFIPDLSTTEEGDGTLMVSTTERIIEHQYAVIQEPNVVGAVTLTFDVWDEITFEVVGSTVKATYYELIDFMHDRPYETTLIKVKDPQPLDDIFTGTYYVLNMWGDQVLYTLDFAKNTETEAIGDGTLSITGTTGYVTKFSYTASPDKSTINCVYEDGPESIFDISFEVNEDGTVTFKYSTFMSDEMTVLVRELPETIR